MLEKSFAYSRSLMFLWKTLCWRSFLCVLRLLATSFGLCLHCEKPQKGDGKTSAVVLSKFTLIPTHASSKVPQRRKEKRPEDRD
jgi:hypothetical protein